MATTKKPAAKTAVKKPAAKKATSAASTAVTTASAKKPKAAAKKVASAPEKAVAAAAKRTRARKAAPAPAPEPVKPVTKKKPAAKKVAAPKAAPVKKPAAKKAAAPVAVKAPAKPRVRKTKIQEAVPQFIVNPRSITMVVGGKPKQMSCEHPEFGNLRRALETKNWTEAHRLIDVKEGLKAFSQGRVKVDGNSVLLDGKRLNGTLVSRLIKGFKEGDEKTVKSLAAFLERAQKNPSFRVVSRIYDFLKANDIEITEDGCFLAWKTVRDNFKDVHSGTMDNSPGQTVSMPRNNVQDDDRITCSDGLHVCSKSYLRHFNGAKVVQVKVDPADVVSVPTDYNNAKMRVCQYDVLKYVGSHQEFLRNIDKY